MAKIGVKYPFLGADVKENDDNEIILGPDKDIEYVGESENVAQAIKRRLETPVGHYQREPYYGSRLNEFVGLGNSKDVRAEIKDAIVESLTRETRIKSIYSVSVELYPGLVVGSNPYAALGIAINVKLIDSPNPLSAVYSFYLPTGKVKLTNA